MKNRFDTRWQDLDEDSIREGILRCAEGDEDAYHTDTPWKVLEYAAGPGDLHTILLDNMERQAKGLYG
ncbi:MAG: kinase to dihydroxyacetone kinase [Gemmiger sp.]|uniref:kinase to dihydroxyacetone kinase n=1 Tax=Gemmiger sp. TaxID=2049027 RepID=UPI002E775147|nr:kinase to dihydroxyacetone kinase [Gemmiger sp.]MEE0801133.1 kinase to dihydroxyacetone kinase [Gemmiger sp.]